MSSLDPSNFKEHLLSHMVKAMLRNPEVVLPTVNAVLRGLKFDLSPFAMEIGKQLGAQLHSKVEQSRKFSIDGSRLLASKCADSAVVEDLVKHYFGVLTGSEGICHFNVLFLPRYSRQFYNRENSIGITMLSIGNSVNKVGKNLFQSAHVFGLIYR